MSLFWKSSSCPIGATNLNDILGKYSSDEFESHKRSTIPLFSLLKYDRSCLSTIIGRIGIAKPIDLFVEYEVAPSGINGHASCTDLMVVGANRVAAIETKWTERNYPIVDKWLNRTSINKAHQQVILNGWISILQGITTRNLGPNCLNNEIYQMVTRAASAIKCAATKEASMVYLIFCQSPNSAQSIELENSLRSLRAAIGISGTGVFPFFLAEVMINPTSNWNLLDEISKLAERFPVVSHKKPIKAAVIKAGVIEILKKESMFDFKLGQVKIIC